MNGKIRPSRLLQSPYIQIRAKVTMPGTTNGKPNIKEELRYVLPPSVKKIAKYITNQIFGSDLVTQTEGLDINWIMPTLSTALEDAIYDKEAFIYIHKFNNKVYLECLKKCDIHDLVQKYDQIISFKLYEDFDVKDENGRDITMSLERKVKINGDGTSTIEMKAFEKNEKDNEWNNISLERFNRITENEYSLIYNLPYEVLVNIDIGEEFFKDSEKLINEEMILLNTMAEEIEKTKTRIVTTQHYQSGDIVGSWSPSSNMYDVQQMNLGTLQDYFTLLPGDREHQVFEFLQGDIRVKEYTDTFKFYDYQIIQMANLSPATFGYEKDAYMNNANVDLSANASEMTIEAIKRQLEPQINRLMENIIRLQQSQEITKNLIPVNLVWDYGANERIDDMKKLEVLQDVQRAMSVPYSIRAKIVKPILNKLVDDEIDEDTLVKEWQDENNKMDITFGEL